MIICCISGVKDHAKFDIHFKRIKQKDKKYAEEANKIYCRKVTLSTPQNSANVNSLNGGSVKEKESLHKLSEVAYLITKRRRPITEYHNLIKLEKLHGVKFDITYDNKSASADFIRYISQSLFSINVKLNLKRVNFITVLCGRATDIATVQKEYVFLYCLLILTQPSESRDKVLSKI